MAIHSSILAWNPMDKGAQRATTHGAEKELDMTQQLNKSNNLKEKYNTNLREYFYYFQDLKCIVTKLWFLCHEIIKHNKKKLSIIFNTFQVSNIFSINFSTSSKYQCSYLIKGLLFCFQRLNGHGNILQTWVGYLHFINQQLFSQD